MKIYHKGINFRENYLGTRYSQNSQKLIPTNIRFFTLLENDSHKFFPSDLPRTTYNIREFYMRILTSTAFITCLLHKAL